MKILLLLLILIFTFSAAAQTVGYITAENANLRSLPNEEAPIIATLKNNTKIRVKSAKALKGWYQVAVGKKAGWLHGNTFSLQKPVDSVIKNNRAQISADKKVLLELIKETDRWKFVSSGRDVAYFVDMATIKDDYGKRIVWIKTVLIEVPIKRIAFDLSQNSYDCKNRTSRTLVDIYYDRNSQQIDRRSGFSSEEIIPGSVGETLFMRICNLDVSNK